MPGTSPGMTKRQCRTERMGNLAANFVELDRVTLRYGEDDDGTVVVSGREVAGPLSIVGMAFQNPTLLPWRTTLANVMLPLEIVQPHCARLRGERSIYVAKARDLLALVGLKGFEDRFPWELSGGMQQRASLCRALIHDPSLL